MYLQKGKLDISNDKESINMCRIFETRSSQKISKTKSISYPRIRETFKDFISEISTTPKKFALHSFGSGGASAAANNGILNRLVFKQGRWSPEKATKGYIRNSLFKILTISNTLGL